MIYIYLLTATSIFVILSIVYSTIVNGISPMPSISKARAAMLAFLPDTEGPIYELGSGWGHLLWLLAKRYPKASIIGIESSFIPYLFSRLLFSIFPKKNLVIKKVNFYKTNLSDASLVVCYLYPGAMTKLKKKFKTELKPGTFVISNTFAIPNWKPEKEIVLDDLYSSKIYLYRT